jgi:hypothetical protein
MDYKKKGDEELDLVKDDSLRVFKRYNHWSYVCVLFPGDKLLKFHVSSGCERGRRRSWLGTSKSLCFN